MLERLPPIHLPCGAMANFDYGSGISHRCTTCFATIGSTEMPAKCRQDIEKYELLEKLGGKRWDYQTGNIVSYD